MLRDERALLDRHGVNVVAVALDLKENVAGFVEAEKLGFPVLVVDLDGATVVAFWSRHRGFAVLRVAGRTQSGG